jgi:hypothetical protein
MKIVLILAVLAVVIGFVIYKNKPPEVIPQPKAAATGLAPAVSTVAVVEQNPLKMPANYLKVTLGHVNEAKAAKALYEKTEKDQMGGFDKSSTGGN